MSHSHPLSRSSAALRRTTTTATLVPPLPFAALLSPGGGGATKRSFHHGLNAFHLVPEGGRRRSAPMPPDVARLAMQPRPLRSPSFDAAGYHPSPATDDDPILTPLPSPDYTRRLEALRQRRVQLEEEQRAVEEEEQAAWQEEEARRQQREQQQRKEEEERAASAYIDELRSTLDARTHEAAARAKQAVAQAAEVDAIRAEAARMSAEAKQEALVCFQKDMTAVADTFVERVVRPLADLKAELADGGERNDGGSSNNARRISSELKGLDVTQRAMIHSLRKMSAAVGDEEAAFIAALERRIAAIEEEARQRVTAARAQEEEKEKKKKIAGDKNSLTARWEALQARKQKALLELRQVAADEEAILRQMKQEEGKGQPEAEADRSGLADDNATTRQQQPQSREGDGQQHDEHTQESRHQQRQQQRPAMFTVRRHHHRGEEGGERSPLSEAPHRQHQHQHHSRGQEEMPPLRFTASGMPSPLRQQHQRDALGRGAVHSGFEQQRQQQQQQQHQQRQAAAAQLLQGALTDALRQHAARGRGYQPRSFRRPHEVPLEPFYW